MDRWITDTEISPRFPYYTRANADEVGPDPFSPLGWSLGWAKGCVPGVAKGFIEFGVLNDEEFALTPREVFGNWGGYFYNQLSLPRIMGVRMPGATPEAIDQAYFGDHPGVPPYTPHPEDENEAATAKLAETMGWAMSTSEYPAQQAASDRAKAAVASRPNLSALSDSELVAYGRSMATMLDDVWVPYCQSCLGASLGPGAIQAICAAIGRPSDAVKVMAAVGDVESAEASFAMWEISRLVHGSKELTAAFDAPLDQLLPTLEASGSADAKSFLSSWNTLLANHGHRGPNEWDMAAPSWTTKPTLALGMLERLRHQDDARSPLAAKAKAASERERIAAELLEMVKSDKVTHGTLNAAFGSASVFFSAREMGKNACIRVIHEAKLAFLELARRHVTAGNLANDQQVFLLLDDELEGFLANPAEYQARIGERETQFAELATRVPPYIIKLEEGVPPIHSWPLKGASGDAKAKAGESLQGAPGASGVVTGRARVILDPSDAGDLEPGDIMVAPTTDPSWTPLFLSVAGVVVNVGAVASHAAIVCRELGVPCAVSVVHATDRIPEGATITIDGSTGLVTIDKL
jgi:rifampicin phosphotransferase